MSDSLKYMRKIVSFMVYDQDANNFREYSSLDEQKSINQLKRDLSNERDVMDQMEEQNQSAQMNSVDNFNANYNHDPSAPIPIERLVKSHPFELLEVLLTWV